MELVLQIGSLENLAEQVAAVGEKCKLAAQEAMAFSLASLGDANFNGDGEQCKQWRYLSLEYSTVVQRKEATLILTAGESERVNRHYKKETVPGLLRSSTRVETDDPDHSTVINDCDYAAYHQWGERPFLPISEDGALTAAAESEIRAAAEQAISEVLSGS